MGAIFRILAVCFPKLMLYSSAQAAMTNCQIAWLKQQSCLLTALEVAGPWLRLQASNARGQVLSLVGKLGTHMPNCMAKKWMLITLNIVPYIWFVSPSKISFPSNSVCNRNVSFIVYILQCHMDYLKILLFFLSWVCLYLILNYFFTE